MSGIFRTIDPPPPLLPASVSSPAVRGWGSNISEDSRHWIGLLQYNPSTVFRIQFCNPSLGPEFGTSDSSFFQTRLKNLCTVRYCTLYIFI